jgi:hypothetical protein
MELLLNSYADAYRVQLQRTGDVLSRAVDVKQMETDLQLLRDRAANSSEILKAQTT